MNISDLTKNAPHGLLHVRVEMYRINNLYIWLGCNVAQGLAHGLKACTKIFTTVTLQLAVGNDMVMSRDISLEASATEELLGWIKRNLPKIKGSGFQRVSFENVSEQLQRRITQLLNH